MKILVTGGTGYIGSHTAVELINSGYEVVIADNLYNSEENIKNKIEAITGKKVALYVCDIADKEAMKRVFGENEIGAVIHFAAYKAVGESCQKPLMYYENNIAGTLSLCESMSRAGCRTLVFSSSATVYGTSQKLPFTEDSPVSSTNPYGTTKMINETLLGDLHKFAPDWNISLLRYFNPIGAHESGLIGEKPNGIPNNIMPYICLVANGTLPKLNVFGNDYNTPDGTGVRDYIHVVDLAKGHIAALEAMKGKSGYFDIFNLGTGNGFSVLQLVNAFEKANGIKIPYQICARRPGDIASSYADASKALRVLGWKAERDIYDMVKSSWNFYSQSAEK
ncbi:UDP-glucose 4-epimerase [bioreactor metagenome]|uniref:UDP-glucose 4-epimerase n=1 Tax=bioreactor metagenome TaxID=1076179 RepID=A0A645B247_9ZZZZ|nr:UDP-glucose 4-epimerase GalE [Oscillospiraceae bacterium]